MADLKVLHVAGLLDPAYGGPVVGVLGDCAGQRSIGVEVEVISTDRTHLSKGTHLIDPGNFGFTVHQFPAHWPRGYSSSWRMVRPMRRLVRSSDLVHIHSLYNFPAALAALMCRREGVPYIVEPHGALTRHHHRHRRAKKWAFERLIDFPMMRHADAVRCSSERERLDLDHLGLTAHAFVLPHGVDLPPIPMERTGARDDGSQTVLVLGRIAAKKQLPRTIAAMATVLEDHPTARMRIVGSGEPSAVARAHEAAEASGVAPQVDFVGHVDPDARWAEFERADVFVTLSDDENFGRTVLEAVAMGLPTVATHNVSSAISLAEVAEVRLVPPDATAAGRAISSVLGDSSVKARAATAAGAVKETLSASSIALQMREHYNQVVAQHRSREEVSAHDDAVVAGSVPDYRIEVIAELREARPRPLKLLFGNSDFSDTVRSGIEPSALNRPVTNRYLLNRRLLVQPRAIRPTVRAHTTVLVFNPRVITTWYVALFRRILGRPTVLWGHVEGRGGSSTLAWTLRSLQAWIAGNLIVYTDKEATRGAASFRGVHITTAPNAIYSRDRHNDDVPSDDPGPIFIYSGRLVSPKKVDVAIDAFATALAEEAVPANATLRIVGDGPERQKLEQQVRDRELEDSINFLGRIPADDYCAWAELYSEAIASVCAGYVGLNAIQSLWFGVPVITPLGEPHAPEFDALTPGTNAVTADASTPAQLSKAFGTVWSERRAWNARRVSNAERCRKEYCVERTAQGINIAMEQAELRNR